MIIKLETFILIKCVLRCDSEVGYYAPYTKVGYQDVSLDSYCIAVSYLNFNKDKNTTVNNLRMEMVQ